MSHRTEHGGDRQTCARGSCGDTTGAVAPDQPPPATWAGWPGASVAGDTGRVTTVWCQQRPGGQGTPAGAGEQQPGALRAGGSRRGAVQECRRGAGRQDRRQRRFCSVVLWLEMAAVAHVVTPSQLTLDTGGDLAGSSTAPLHGMNGARPDTGCTLAPARHHTQAAADRPLKGHIMQSTVAAGRSDVVGGGHAHCSH